MSARTTSPERERRVAFTRRSRSGLVEEGLYMSQPASTKIDELLADYPVVVVLPVVWGEMDSYRHVNNVVYFRYFESARLEYFRRMDWFEYERVHGVGPILAATEARFRKPLTYPDTISVAARISELGDERFTMLYRLVSHRLGAVATEGQGTIVTFNYQEGKKVNIPDEIRQRIADVEARRR